MKDAVMERPVVPGKVEWAVGSSNVVQISGRQVPLGPSSFSGNMLHAPEWVIDPKTGRPHEMYWGKTLGPKLYISPDGQKQAETYQDFVSSEED